MRYTIISLILFWSFNGQAHHSFEAWKESYIKRASQRGLPKSFVRKALKDVKVNPTVIQKDRKQVILSKKKDYQKFMKRWLRANPSRIETGKRLLKEHHDLLVKVEKKYGVDKEIIVALWGVETFYGQIMGSYDLIESLATLAYEGRRRRFFEIQLNALLRFYRQGHVKREHLIGSWAGATGQCQFMPSNLKVYAQDFDGDGRRDIWTNHGDIFASIAYFLKRVGWKKGQSIGVLVDKKQRRTPPSTRKIASIPFQNSPLILRGQNFKPLMAWNRSSLFAAFNIVLLEGFNQ